MDPALIKYASMSTPKARLFPPKTHSPPRQQRKPIQALPMDTPNRLDLIRLRRGSPFNYWIRCILVRCE